MITKKPMTTPSIQWIERAGMPICGPVFGATTLRSDAFGTSALVATARVREAFPTGVVMGHVALAQRDGDAIPGTSAWSPPLC